MYIPQLLIKIQIYFSTLNFMAHLTGPNSFHLADNFVAGLIYACYTILMNSRVESSSLKTIYKCCYTILHKFFMTFTAEP